MNGTTKPETDTEAASPNERLVSGQDLNARLRAFSMTYRLDGDLLYCRGCSRAILASRMDEDMHHHAECEFHPGDTKNPWLILKQILSAH